MQKVKAWYNDLPHGDKCRELEMLALYAVVDSATIRRAMDGTRKLNPHVVKAIEEYLIHWAAIRRIR